MTISHYLRGCVRALSAPVAATWLLVQPPMASAGPADPLSLPARQSQRARVALLTDIVALGRRLVACGERGIIVYSDNRGSSWQQAEVPVSVNLTALSFVNASVGWAAGHDGVILHTRDGGLSWSKQFDGNRANQQLIAAAELRLGQARARAMGQGQADAERQLRQAEDALAEARAGARFGPARPMLGLWFKNVHEGYAVGSFGQLFHTTDGGVNWHSIGERLKNPNNLHYNAIRRSASGIIMIVGEGGHIHTSGDDGLTWRLHELEYTGQLYGALALTGTTGETLLAYGAAGRIFRSQDSGGSWADVRNEPGKTIVAGVALEDGGASLVTSDGQLLRSDGPGLSFRAAGHALALPVAAMARLPDGAIALAGLRGVRVLAPTTQAK